MNEEQFQKTLENQIKHTELDITFLYDWYKKTMELMETLGKQRSAIQHPRHRGDTREEDFQDMLRTILPGGLSISKGYAINPETMTSLEQDCLIFDSNQGVDLTSNGSISHLPVETILASVEVKSKLTLSELRRAVINCVSLKKIASRMGSWNVPDFPQICYSIFAYEAPGTLEETTKRLNKYLENVPPPLRINMAYVLGQGLITPVVDEAQHVVIAPDQVMQTERKYKGFESMGVWGLGQQKAFPFLWFIFNIVDHSLNELRRRKPVSYLVYLFGPLALQAYAGQELEKMLQEYDHWLSTVDIFEQNGTEVYRYKRSRLMFPVEPCPEVEM